MSLMSPPQLSPIERLPRELRRAIFHILFETSIKTPRQERSVNSELNIGPDFTFAPAVQVLLVNKMFYVEAKDVLKDKKCVRINLKWGSDSLVSTAMNNHDVPYFLANHPHPFVMPVATILIIATFPKAVTSTSLGIVLEDILSFCRCMHMLDLANDSALSATFKFFGSPTLKTQEQVLYSFEMLNGVKATMKVAIAGDVDPALGNRVKTNMTQSIGWLRALEWETYDLIVGIKHDGDLCFQAGQHGVASFKYGQAISFLDAVSVHWPYYHPILLTA